MKAAIVLCILAALCAVDAQFNALNMLKNQLDKAKSTVDDTLRKIERLSQNTESDTMMRVNNKKYEFINNFIRAQESAVLDTRNEVHKARLEGKDAEPCFAASVIDLKILKREMINMSEECAKTAQNSMKSALSFLSTLNATGLSLIQKLNSIFPSCASSNINQMQSCIAIELGTTNAAIRMFENEANSAEFTAKSASNKIFLDANNCMSRVQSSAHSRVTELRIINTKCVAAAPKVD